MRQSKRFSAEKNLLKRAVFSAQIGCHYTVILVSEKRILNSYKITVQMQPQKGPYCNPVNYDRAGLGLIFAECVLFVLERSDILSMLSVIATNSEVWFRK